MAMKLGEISKNASDRWQGFVNENTAYIEMALESEIQQIMFRDGPAVFGDPPGCPSASSCVRTVADSLDALREDGIIIEIDTEAAARLISAASNSVAQWIANSSEPEATSKRAVKAF